jgi:hypothetical protein
VPAALQENLQGGVNDLVARIECTPPAPPPPTTTEENEDHGKGHGKGHGKKKHDDGEGD